MRENRPYGSEGGAGFHPLFLPLSGIPVSVGPVPSPGVSRIFHGVRSPEALLAWPSAMALKVPPQKVEAFAGRLDDPRLGWVRGQPHSRGPLPQKIQDALGLGLGPAPHHPIVRRAHPVPPSPFPLMVQRIEVHVG